VEVDGHDEIPIWSNNHPVLLSNAADPVLPFGFSGASISIEDAVVLAIMLPTEVNVDEISNRVKMYEQMRRPHVERMW
jgi:salicylate hydroxylase